MNEATSTHDQPVTFIASDFQRKDLEAGMAMCLSGGGYRAMLFHLGSLLRVHEAGLLKRMERISSVSGGSITAAQLALAWPKLANDPAGTVTTFVKEVIEPVRRLADRTIDAGAVLGGVLLPGSVGDRVEKSYARILFGDATLQDLPDTPRFVINATNVQSGALWRFSKPYMADYRVGLYRNPRVPLAKAVAASSAFPPVLSPVELELDHADCEPKSGLDLQKEPFTTDILLTDGGVYDNLGLETVWKRYKTVLVSDAGGTMEPEANPKRDWGRHAYRVLLLIDNQVRSLRKRQILNAFTNDQDPHNGAYWGIRTNIQHYGVGDALACPMEKVYELAATPTRLKGIPSPLQERIINWGYAVTDAAIRKYVDPSVSPPKKFPYDRGV